MPNDCVSTHLAFINISQCAGPVTCREKEEGGGEEGLIEGTYDR